MINKPKLVDEYFEWLCTLVDVDQQGASYWSLMIDLFKEPFYWTVPNDDNRAFDGMMLREQFCDDIQIDYYLDDFPTACTMLELIMGIAQRCHRITIDHGRGFLMIDWFWKILDNCGLSKFDDKRYDSAEVSDILCCVLERKFSKTGEGGFFPLKKCALDQRKVEIWYQMNTYLVENYYS